MNDMTQDSFDRFLDAVATRSPTPGGGAVAAAAGAFACSLARMVAAYSVNPRTEPDDRCIVGELAAKLHLADEMLRGLITRDAEAYEAMTEAARQARQDASPKDKHQRCVLDAASVPAEVAAAISHVLRILDESKSALSRHLFSDLAVASIIGEAASRAARAMVAVNLPLLSDGPAREQLADEINRIVGHCQAHSRSIEEYVGMHLQRGG